MEAVPEQMTVCTLTVLVMPQGEIICKGKTLGWFRELGEFLEVKKEGPNEK